MPPGGRWLRTRWDTRLYPANRGIVSVLTPCAERMISPFFTIIVFRRAKLQKSMNKMQSSLYKSCTSVQFLRGRLVQPRRRHSRRPYTGLRAAGSRMWFPDRSLWIFSMPCGSFRPVSPGLTLTYLTSVTLINVNGIGLRLLGRHLFARGLLPFSSTWHVKFFRSSPDFSTCTCKWHLQAACLHEKRRYETASPVLLMQRYEIFSPKARNVKSTGSLI